MDNIWIERLWRSLKYEEVYLRTSPAGIRNLGCSSRRLRRSPCEASICESWYPLGLFCSPMDSGFKTRSAPG